MAATNIFYRIPTHRGTRVASIAGTECTLDQFCNHIFDTEGLNRRDFIVASGTKVFRSSSCNLQSISLQNNSHVDILIPLLGGKGGFGSLLRAIGAQIEKTTNRDACRDLSGRRLRDIKREDELKKLIELQTKLVEERKRRKREKLEKLKKRSELSKTSASIQELVNLFDDHAFNRRRLELGDIIDAAVEKGLINSKKRQSSQAEEDSSKRVRLEESNKSEIGSDPSQETDAARPQVEDEDRSHTITIKSSENMNTLRKNPHHSRRKKDLWLGLEDEGLYEVEEEEEEEEEGHEERAKTVVV